MRIRGLRKLILALLCAALLVLPFLSLMLTAAHADHDCAATRCPAWPAVFTARAFLRQVFPLLVGIVLALAVWLNLRACARRDTRRRRADTPVDLKVRLNP